MKTYQPDWDINSIPDKLILKRAAQINGKKSGGPRKGAGRPLGSKDSAPRKKAAKK